VGDIALSGFPRHKRILLLGPTGVDKAQAVARLNQHLQKQGHEFKFVDFENSFLKNDPGVRTWMHFLAQDPALQAAAWRRAWDQFKTTLDNEPIILGLHGSYVSGVLGLRCPIHIPSICADFAPTLIVTLIDDVYSLWQRTEARAGGREDKGRPSFEQLLIARRAEQILGDIVSSHCPQTPRHILCATHNAIDSLANLIVFNSTITYLSFPISEPRELAKKGDKTFIEIINRAHHLAADLMKAEHERAFVTPLAIDELPFLAKARNRKKGNLIFNGRKDRWSAEELWGKSSVPILPTQDKDVPIPLEELQKAGGIIVTDVGWRDRRLVFQSNSLAIVCPKPPSQNRITRGVEDEIQTAVTLGTVCNYWQYPAWDRKNFLATRFPAAGSMGIGQTQALVQRKDSLEELIRAKP
jgi:hypothetical protein